MSASPQKADILFGGESQHPPLHAELRQPLDFAVARLSAKIIEMSLRDVAIDQIFTL